ncbi:MAG: sigma-54-dependent Fis family transcriptional regulator [Gammaproteobacteria bacterium]|nr:sigma-54-dependent Fis family transcriptional regulator [Gammaproteobacteria bacterium]
MNTSRILIVEDDRSLREALSDTLELAGYDVAAVEDGQAALMVLRQGDFALVISDVQMPGMDGYGLLKKLRENRVDIPFILMTAYGTIQKAVEAMHNGASDYLVKPFEADAFVEIVQRYLPVEPVIPMDLIVEDPASKRLVHLAERVAKSDATVMISGSSGTGKEVYARYIHAHSLRSEGPFVAINCAAIPENMLEAVLFGYEKGAFTGAYQASPGKFEQAQGGTLLLDEISEMDLALQAKLLRVLQEREVERLGSQKIISLNVRVLATSNRIMREEVAAGRFREDLFYRLNVFPLLIPPLRERREDILPIARRKIEAYRSCLSDVIPQLSQAAEAVLFDYAWPGNVRELENLIQRAMIFATGSVIDVEALQFEEISSIPQNITAPAAAEDDGLLDKGLKQQEYRLILDALNTTGGNRKEVATRLGISPRTLRYKMARMRDAGIAIPG